MSTIMWSTPDGRIRINRSTRRLDWFYVTVDGRPIAGGSGVSWRDAKAAADWAREVLGRGPLADQTEVTS